ncbi:MAG: hypothetical protein ACLPSF_02195 [Methylocella sp.]
MLLELVGLLALSVGAAAPAEIDAALAAPARAWAAIQEISPTALTARASFRPDERVVTNWRLEAAQRLASTPQSLAKLVTVDSAATPRCIKLNNYWCVKRAGWAGEIAADADGHVAFASALEGATVAVMLLRRYYLVYDRRSAQAIVSHWAPAECDALAAAGRQGPAFRLPASGLHGLATHGIANTLRARWLASHRPGFGGPAAFKPHRSVVADHPIRMMAAPEIAVGMGEHSSPQTPLTIAALEAMPIFATSAPRAACADESARIRQYALRAVEGVGAGPDDDLRLFAADGAPGANLSAVLQNMAKVEIGPFGARSDLIAAAIEVETQQDRSRRSGAAQLTGAAK